MIIKLIQPRMIKRPMDTGLKTKMSPSLGLLTIANMLQDKHTIIYENENIKDIDFDEKVDIVGISITVDIFPRACEIAKIFQSKNIPVVAGGIHITANPDESEKYFDALSIGLAELTWYDIISDFEKGQLKKRYYHNTSNITPNSIISPAYNLINKSEYLYYNIISTSRGCPYKCNFCYNSTDAYKNLYISRSVQDVIKDIKAINNRHIMFIDDNLIGNPVWTFELLEAITPLNLKWNAAVSSNVVNIPNMLDKMKSAGCQSLFIGFESINTSSIEDAEKVQNNVERYNYIVSEIHKRGIMINASFVFGLDGDNKDTFKNTLKWIVDNKIETVTSHILTPYPGTELFKKLKSSGRIIDDDYAKYNTANVVFMPKNMSPDELKQGYLKIYKDIYSFKNIIKRMPKSKNQWIPYLLFNIFYRKFGKFTDFICSLIGYKNIGRLAALMSYKTK